MMLESGIPAIQFNNIQFKPAILTSLITLVLLYIMISMGLWQLDRADYKSNLQTIIEARKNLQPISMDLIQLTDDKWMFQPAIVQGEWDLTQQMLLDNQVNNGQAGYRVYTPLMLGPDKAILVDRGWLPVGADRSILPELSFDATEFSRWQGTLVPSPSKGLVLSDMANRYSEWPLRLQYIDSQEISAHTGYDLLPFVLQLNSSHTALDVLPIKVNMRSEKHTAYAFQWFALSFALLIIYIIVNSKKIKPAI